MTPRLGDIVSINYPDGPWMGDVLVVEVEDSFEATFVGKVLKKAIYCGWKVGSEQFFSTHICEFTVLDVVIDEDPVP